MPDRRHHYGDHEAVSECDVDVPCAGAGSHNEDSASADEDQREGSHELGGGPAEDVFHTRVEARERIGRRLRVTSRSSLPLHCAAASPKNKKAAVCGPFLKAAGLGFEPRLLGPEPSVLPLDDPARGLGL